MQHYAAFHLGLHCLPKNPLRGFQYAKGLVPKSHELAYFTVQQEKEFLEEEAGGATLAANVLVNLSDRSTHKLEEYR